MGAMVTTDRPRARRWLWRSVAGVVAVLVAVVAGLVVAYPVVAAAVCPGCYGLSEAAPGVYVDDDATAEQQSEMVDVVAAARQRVRDFLGDTRSNPRILICLSADCYGRIGGGGEKGQALRDHAIALSPDGATVVIAGHEMVHAELYERLGSRYGDVPAWFHEGLAVLISDDRRYLTGAPAGERCPIDHALALAATRDATPRSPDLYRNGACVVDRWVATNGGVAAVDDVVRRLREGEPFAVTP
jgi:hypothetical protein